MTFMERSSRVRRRGGGRRSSCRFTLQWCRSTPQFGSRGWSLASEILWANRFGNGNYTAELCTWLQFFCAMCREIRGDMQQHKSPAEESRLIGVYGWSKERDALSGRVGLALTKLCSASENIFPCRRWNNVYAVCLRLSVNPFCACVHVCTCACT
jgi:hypothetical protein